jgi:hypothetical protein
MAQVYFHCANSERVVIDRCGAAVGDLIEAQDHATCMMRSLVTAMSPEDWRDWTVHVTDELDDEIFVMPFSSVLGKPH